MRPRIRDLKRLALPLLGAAFLVAPAPSPAATAARAGAARPAASRDSSRVLVRIGSDVITRAQVQQRIEELPEQYRTNYSTPPARQQLLDRMVEERIWLMLATRSGVASRPKVRQQLEQQRRDLLIRTYLNEQMAANGAPSDSDARVYYDTHPAEYKTPATVTVRHIQCATEAEAKRMKQWAKGGQDFAKLAQKYSADTLSRANGGAIGVVTHDGMFSSIGAQPALAQSAFALGEGKVGGPYKTTRGWHVIKVEALRPEGSRSFDQVRPMIVRQLSAQRSQEFYRSLLEKARRDLHVTPDSTAIKGFLSQKRPPRELFKEAQETAGATERIAAYRRVLEEYPDSDVSPQAQFMIGFINSEELKNYDEAEKAFRALLHRYPKSELAASAQWMVDHMRTEEAPAFMNLEGDSSQAASGTPGAKSPRRDSTGKP